MTLAGGSKYERIFVHLMLRMCFNVTTVILKLLIAWKISAKDDGRVLEDSTLEDVDNGR